MFKTFMQQITGSLGNKPPTPPGKAHQGLHSHFRGLLVALAVVAIMVALVQIGDKVASGAQQVPDKISALGSPITAIVSPQISAVEQTHRIEAAQAKQAQFIEQAQNAVTLALFDKNSGPVRKFLLTGFGLLLIGGATFGLRGLIGGIGTFSILFAVLLL